MTITKVWSINDMTRNKNDGYVYSVSIICKGMEGSKEVSSSGYEVDFMDKPNELPSEFIDYEKLDEATVLAWCKTKLGTELVATIERACDDLPNLANGKPW
tara:strand:- start:125 stop:427 length:303 start_codon:yes stop_codon:yes gene_type:complete